MSSDIEMYYFEPSPPSRAVLMLAKAIGLTLNLKRINILEGEQMSPEYLKINPQHTVPTVNDNGFILWESHVIMKYLVEKYTKDVDVLSPRDPQKAAIMNQRLFFNAAVLSPRLAEYFFPVLAAGAQPSETKLAKFEEALGYLETFLETEMWVAGSQMTIADFSIITTISTAEACMVNISKYPHITAWYNKAKKAMDEYGYKDINQAGADIIGGMFRSKVK